jgi:hypothetical protein
LGAVAAQHFCPIAENRATVPMAIGPAIARTTNTITGTAINTATRVREMPGGIQAVIGLVSLDGAVPSQQSHDGPSLHARVVCEY